VNRSYELSIDSELAPVVEALAQMATPDFADIDAARAAIVDMIAVMNEASTVGTRHRGTRSWPRI